LFFKDLLNILHGHTGNIIQSLAFNADGLLASGSTDGTIRFWDVTTGVSTKKFEEKGGAVSLAFNGKDLLASSRSTGAGVKIWDVKTGDFLQIAQENFHRGVAFSRDGLLAFTVLSSVKIWNGVSIVDLPWGHHGTITTLAFSSNGLLASGSADRQVIIWDLKARNWIKKLQGHTEIVSSVAFNTAGILASGSYDQTIRIWDITSGECLKTLVHNGNYGVSSVAFSNTGILASASDGTVKIWKVMLISNVCYYQSLKTLYANYRLESVVLDAEGTLVACGGWDKAIRVWRV